MEPESTCPVCFDTFNEVIYYTIDGINWLPHKYCIDCLKDIQEGAWNVYINNIKKADCEKSLKTCLEHGIPNRLTVDCKLISPVMQAIKFKGEVMPTELNMAISDDDLKKLNSELGMIYDKMVDSDVFDYINEINSILTKYNL